MEKISEEAGLPGIFLLICSFLFEITLMLSIIVAYYDNHHLLTILFIIIFPEMIALLILFRIVDKRSKNKEAEYLFKKKNTIKNGKKKTSLVEWISIPTSMTVVIGVIFIGFWVFADVTLEKKYPVDDIVIQMLIMAYACVILGMSAFVTLGLMLSFFFTIIGYHSEKNKIQHFERN